MTVTACGGGNDDAPPPTAVAPAPSPVPAPAPAPSPYVARTVPATLTIAETDCSTARIGQTIPLNAIGEPVSAVTLTAVTWNDATANLPAYCRVDGSMDALDPNAPPIRFAVALPGAFGHRAVQLGGGGNNGSIPGLTGGGHLARGWAVLGSDSGHQGNDASWALHDEAIRNFGYMQLKKTHDAAWVIIQRLYGVKPVYSYFIGNSQGGREALTVVQRYPDDYDGVVATVPVLSFSNLTVSRVWHRIQEMPLANWVTPAKRTAISTHVVRSCDGLDGLADGVINNYIGCRQVFDVTRRSASTSPWAAIRCPNNVDPNPADTSASACLTDGQIKTMEFAHKPYVFARPVAHGNPRFDMWMPNTDPGGSGMIVSERYRGQEGATANAPVYDWLGSPHVIEGLFRSSAANPLTYMEGAMEERRQQLSSWLDSTNPDLGPYYAKGGRLIVMFGTFDSLASSGAQAQYYEALLQKMGRTAVDQIARLYVLPNGGHGLSGSNFPVNGDGQAIPTSAIPNQIDRTQLIIDWVEKNVAPPMSPTLSGGGRTMPLCSYPQYPRYKGNGLPTTQAESYECVTATAQ
ncbi:tannase/feruloyl esterase family alpha/beta hydrolase [Piscinibacter sakaiensis]